MSYDLIRLNNTIGVGTEVHRKFTYSVEYLYIYGIKAVADYYNKRNLKSSKFDRQLILRLQPYLKAAYTECSNLLLQSSKYLRQSAYVMPKGEDLSSPGELAQIAMPFIKQLENIKRKDRSREEHYIMEQQLIATTNAFKGLSTICDEVFSSNVQ
jgi:hypothetical protein